MPIVQAYQCPRTKKLFVDKAKYVSHLKVVALDIFCSEKNPPRLAILQRKFDEMRKTARSFDDISKWVENHPRYIQHIAMRLRNLTTKPSKKPIVLHSVRWTNIQFLPYIQADSMKPKHGVYFHRNDPGSRAAYPGIKGDFHFISPSSLSLNYVLSQMACFHTGSGGSDAEGDASYSFTMFAEDWPFIGAQALFEAAGRKNRDTHLRVLQYAFPGITQDQYLMLHSAGLLPETLDEFTTFMFQYVSEVPKVTHVPTVAMPDDIAASLDMTST